jgi:uroporphyrinogen III methyltransferase/synthase
VLYDRLAPHETLAELAPNAELIDVGKRPGHHPIPQEEIERLIVAHAEKGSAVVRLKGGDPFVFGRGGEEAAALARAGVPWEVVPGVTSAVAVPAYAGIPVTQRDVAGSFAVVTGHGAAGRRTSPADLALVARAVDTVVVLMGLSALDRVVAELMAGGRPPGEPAAVISWGTTPRQRTVTAALADVNQAARRAGLTNPAVLVVGRVVALRESLAWFEKRPLFGRRVVVTRGRDQAGSLVAAIREAGGEPVELPTIAILPPADWGPVDAAIAALQAGRYHWVCFTSRNGADGFLRRVWHLGGDARRLAGTAIAAVGRATAERLAEAGLRPDVVAEEATAAGLVAALTPRVGPGSRVLFPRGDRAGPTLRDGLQRLGCSVDDPVVYRTVADPGAGEAVRRLLAEGGADAVTFASASAVEHFLDALGERAREVCRGAVVVCIGPTTAAAAERAGLRVDAVAPRPSAEALVDSLCRLWGGDAGGGRAG